MTVKMVTDLPAPLVDEAWILYTEAFRELNALAVQRHLMYRHEFDEVVADRRVRKYLAVDDGGRLTGLATYTNHLEAMPLLDRLGGLRAERADEQSYWMYTFPDGDTPPSAS
jgi:hypothetical protein